MGQRSFLTVYHLIVMTVVMYDDWLDLSPAGLHHTDLHAKLLFTSLAAAHDLRLELRSASADAFRTAIDWSKCSLGLSGCLSVLLPLFDYLSLSFSASVCLSASFSLCIYARTLPPLASCVAVSCHVLPPPSLPICLSRSLPLFLISISIAPRLCLSLFVCVSE